MRMALWCRETKRKGVYLSIPKELSKHFKKGAQYIIDVDLVGASQ